MARRKPDVLRIGSGAGFAGDPKSIGIVTRPISSLDTMQLELAPGGGLAMRIATRNPHAPRSSPKPKPQPPKEKVQPEFDVE